MAIKTVDQFVHDWNGRKINNGGTECVALANQFESDVIGGGWIPANWASDWFNKFGTDADYNNYIRLGAGDTAQKGDLAVWGAYPKAGGGTIPHIALVLGNAGNGLSCLTQSSSTNAHIETLTKSGLLGYLRPKKFIVTATEASAQVQPSGGQQEWVHITGDFRSFYNESGPYVTASRKGQLAPNKFGGLDYQVLGRPANDIVTIQSQDFGRGAIYVGGEAAPLTRFYTKTV